MLICIEVLQIAILPKKIPASIGLIGSPQSTLWTVLITVATLVGKDIARGGWLWIWSRWRPSEGSLDAILWIL